MGEDRHVPDGDGNWCLFKPYQISSLTKLQNVLFNLFNRQEDSFCIFIVFY
jgi:hypothetical protein